MQNFKIKKDNQGKTSVKILENQIITYVPETDSYIVQTELDQVHTSVIPSYLLDQLYNTAWENS